MKKIMFLVTLLMFFTGCSIRDINDYDISAVIDDALSNTNYTANVVFEGYKYYLPSGVTLVDKNAYNSKLLSNSNYYYLYVDVVSYYHKSDLKYEVSDDAFFSKEISFNGKKGYVEVFKKEDYYYFSVIYNYSKIESYVKEDKLNKALYDSIKILASINYNDTILSTIIGDNILDYQEEEYDLFESKRENGNFLDYIEEYDFYEEKDEDVKDEDVLDSEY